MNPFAEYDMTAEEEARDSFDTIRKRAIFLNEGTAEQKRYLNKEVMVEKHKKIGQLFLGSIWIYEGCKRFKDGELDAFIKSRSDDMKNELYDNESIYIEQCKFVRDYTLLFLLKDFIKEKEPPTPLPLEQILKVKEHATEIINLLRINTFLHSDDTWAGKRDANNELAHIFQLLEKFNITNKEKGSRNLRLISFFNSFSAEISIKDLDNFKKGRLASPPSHLNILIEKFEQLGPPTIKIE